MWYGWISTGKSGLEKRHMYITCVSNDVKIPGLSASGVEDVLVSVLFG